MVLEQFEQLLRMFSYQQHPSRDIYFPFRNGLEVRPMTPEASQNAA